MDEAAREKLLKALSTVEDPDLKKDLVSLNMIDDVCIDEKEKIISFKIVFTTPLCPLKNKIKTDCLNALYSFSSQGWKINIAEGFIVKPKIAKKEGTNISKIKNILAFFSGKGGVGKSTLCANVAYNLSKEGASVGILDGDIFGPSILEILGIANAKSKTKELGNVKYLAPVNKEDLKIISISSLTDSSQAIVFRGPLASKVLKQLFFETYWGELDYLFIDLPPGTSDLHITALQSFFIDATIIVTTPHNLSLSDVVRAIEMQKNNFPSVKMLGILENMSYLEYENSEKKIFPFGKNGAIEISKTYNIPVLSQIPLIINNTKPIETTYIEYKNASQKIAQAFSVLNHN